MKEVEQPIMDPVTWQEALLAWGEGETAIVEVDGCKYLFTDTES